MKATDFTIGDLVFVKPSMLPIKVVAIHQRKVGYHAVNHKLNWVRIDFVSPIPLTAEILRKNGFEETPISDLFIEKNLWETYAIELFPSEGSCIIRITDKTNEHIDGCNCINLYIKYIHELQHALKQCKIDKEIVL